MAMLAEPRKKTKYRMQPFSGFSKLKKRCDDDTGSAAFKMMAKMGWAPGKGLGAKESGNTDPIRLRLKHDDAGLGFKVSEDDALAQQSEFQALLLQLNSGSNAGDIEADDSSIESKKPKIKSLEKQSEQSTKRVHYKKFTRGKDLSRASEQDLRSILGLTSKKPKVEEPEPELEAPEVDEDATRTHGVNMYITAGSSVDYFKQRFVEKKKRGTAETVNEATAFISTEDESNNVDNNKRRSVTWGDVDVSYVDKYIKDMVDTSGSVDESLNDVELSEDPPAKKKKKKKNKQVAEESTDIVEESIPVITEKKKKKKSKLIEDENSQENVVEAVENHVESKKKKKKKLCEDENLEENVMENEENQGEPKQRKKRKICEDETLNGNVAGDQENHTEPKKKKKRKLSVIDGELVSDANNFEGSNDSEALITDEKEILNEDSTDEPKQKKKKKKKKRNQVDALPEQSESTL